MREAWTWEVQSLDIDGVRNSIAEGETFWFETYGRFWRAKMGHVTCFGLSRILVGSLTFCLATR
jgi:hypothetical protein